MDFKKKILLFGVAPWAVAALALIFLVLPGIGISASKSATLNEKKNELETLKENVNNIKNLKSIKKTLKEVETELKGFNIMFPPSEELETLYADIQTAFNETSLTLIKLSVSKEKKLKLPKSFFVQEDDSKKKSKKKKKKKKKSRKKSKGPALDPLEVYQRSFKLELIALKYQDIIDFVYYLDNYYRFITLEGIQIKESQPDPLLQQRLNRLSSNITPLNIAIVFSVYSVKTNAIADKSEQKDKKKKKKK